MLQATQFVTPPAQAAGEEIAVEAISIDVVRQGYDYWLSKRGSRPYPSRADIRPGEIKRILPNVILARVMDGGADYEFRVAGQESVAAHGFNPINQRVSQLDRHAKGYTKLMMQVFGRVRRSGEPIAAKGALVHLNRGYRAFESLYLPLGPDGQSVDHIFIVTGYSDDAERGS